MTEAYEKFIRQFSKVSFREEEKRALKKLDTYSLKVDKENRIILINAVFGAYCDKKTVYAAADRIKDTLDLRNVD